MLARSPDLQRCFVGALRANPAGGRLVLTITVEAGGHTTTRAQASSELQGAARCVEQALQSMHVEGTAPGTFRVPVVFAAR